MTLLLDQDDRPRAFTGPVFKEVTATRGAVTGSISSLMACTEEHVVVDTMGEFRPVLHRAPRGFTADADRIDGWILEMYEHVTNVQRRDDVRNVLMPGVDWVEAEMTAAFVELPREVVARVRATPMTVKRELVVAPLDWFDADPSE